MGEKSGNGYVARWLFILAITIIMGLMGVVYGQLLTKVNRTEFNMVVSRLNRMELKIDRLLERGN